MDMRTAWVSASSPASAAAVRNIRHGALEGAPHGGDEELLLGAEELEQVGLRHPDLLGDRVDRRAVQPAYGELAHGDLDDLAPPVLFADPRCRHLCHVRCVS